MNDSIELKYGVARRKDLVSDLYDDVATARQQLAHVEDTMTSIGLKSDVRLVQVEVTTSVGPVEDYVEPVADDEPDVDEPEPEQPAPPAGE